MLTCSLRIPMLMSDPLPLGRFFNFDEDTFAIWTFSTWRTDCSSACVTRGSKAVGKPRPLIMAPITAHTGTPCKTL